MWPNGSSNGDSGPNRRNASQIRSRTVGCSAVRGADSRPPPRLGCPTGPAMRECPPAPPARRSPRRSHGIRCSRPVGREGRQAKDESNGQPCRPVAGPPPGGRQEDPDRPDHQLGEPGGSAGPGVQLDREQPLTAPDQGDRRAGQQRVRGANGKPLATEEPQEQQEADADDGHTRPGRAVAARRLRRRGGGARRGRRWNPEPSFIRPSTSRGGPRRSSRPTPDRVDPDSGCRRSTAAEGLLAD